MNYNQILPIEELKTKASILLKNFKKNDLSDKNNLAKRFKLIPELNNISVDEIIKNKEDFKLKHALRVIALENGFASWKELKDSLITKEDKIVTLPNHKNNNSNNLLIQEFERQIENLLEKGYDKLSGLSKDDFINLIMPLKNKLLRLNINEEAKDSYIPFVIVIKSELIPTEQAMPLIIRNKKNGIVKLDPVEPSNFKPVKEITLPEGVAYLLINIDRGEDTLNITPKDAFELIKKQKRFPLTIDEGIAILTHYPDYLQKNKCFYLSGSRRNDLRIPALWISEGKPKLGWCWNGNPHTWLGSASCADRI